MGYWLYILTLVCIYALLAISLNLIVGQLGILSLAQAAFSGIGAYTSALFSIHLGTSFLISTLLGCAIGVLLSLGLSLPSMRLRGDYFVISTFAFQVVASDVLRHWTRLTGGPLGVSGIPQPRILGDVIGSQFGLLVIAASFLFLAYVLLRLLVLSPYGRVLRGIRENEMLLQSLGKNTVKFKVTAFAISAAIAACAGSIYGSQITFIDPTTFTVMDSILILSMVIIGGTGSRVGPLIGAAVLVLIPEMLRFVGLPDQVAANLRQLIYGVLLIAMMMFRPRGLVGKYGFGR